MPDFSTLAVFVTQIIVLWTASRLMGAAVHRIGLPSMIGEIAAGLLLGPSCLGHFFAAPFGSFFYANAHTDLLRQQTMKAALLVFLFFAGLETSLLSLKNISRAAATVSLAGMAVPFAAGAVTVLLAPAWWAAYSYVSVMKTAIFLGTALSISALPVIARIFIDLKMIKTPNAALVMTAATLNDVLGWLILSAMLVSRHTANLFYEFIPLGAFWVGMLCAGYVQKHDLVMKKISAAALGLAAPLYFASIGLRVDFVTSFDPLLTAVIFGAACLAKTGGVYAGARLGGLPGRDALIVATAMNARGAMEILLATLAFEAGLIGNAFFVALITMALLTTLFAAAALRFQLRSSVR